MGSERRCAAGDFALVYEGFDPSQEGLREALTSTGNGYFCIRGAAEWDYIERGLKDERREFYHGDKRVIDFREHGIQTPPAEYDPPKLDIPTLEILEERLFSFDGFLRWVVFIRPDAVLQAIAKIKPGMIRTPKERVRNAQAPAPFRCRACPLYAVEHSISAAMIVRGPVCQHIVAHRPHPKYAGWIHSGIVAADKRPVRKRKQLGRRLVAVWLP